MTLLAVVFAGFAALSTLSPTEAVRLPAQGTLRQEVADYNSGDSDVFQALQEASMKYGVPLGIEADGLGDRAKHISVHLSKGTLGDIFNALLQEAPNYKWVESNGVVNVMPLQSADSVLDVEIARFRATHFTPDELHAAIRSLPEVKAWLARHHLVERGYFTQSILVGENGKTDQPRASVHLKNATLRQILNAIVKERGFHSWFVGRYGERNEYLNIGIG